MARQHRFDWFSSTQRSRLKSCEKRPRSASPRRPCFEPLEARYLLSVNPQLPLEQPGYAADPTTMGEPVFLFDTVWYAPQGEGSLPPSIDFTAGDPWPDGDPGTDGFQLTYSYSNFLDGTLPGGLTEDELRAATEEALGLWASVAPLHLQEVFDTGPDPSDDDYAAALHPDLRIGHHFIDGSIGANVLAHAFFPVLSDGLAGDVHFDNGNSWGLFQSGNEFDVIEVMLHELGHSLGLGHETTLDAIMNPIIGGRFSGLGTGFLLQDDIDGIQALYGDGVGSVTPIQPYLVDTIVDEDDGNYGKGHLSLREAIYLATEIDNQKIIFDTALAGQTIVLDDSLGSLMITDSVVIEGLGSDHIAIMAPAPNGALSEGGDGQIFVISYDGLPPLTTNVSISGLELTGAGSVSHGGAIFSELELLLTDVNIHGNSTSERGGAVYSTAKLEVSSSTIADNMAADDGGGIHASGGLKVDSSTLSGNSSGDEGGAIAIKGEGSQIEVLSSTISGNSADDDGGGLHVNDLNPTVFRVTHSTIHNNTSTTGSGGGMYMYNGVLALEHTIIAGNSDVGEAPDLDNLNLAAAPAVLAKYSFIGNDEGSLITEIEPNFIGTALAPINPMLDVLEDNGGPSQTHRPMLGSPVIDAGNATLPFIPEFDQRGLGFDRVAFDVIDIGAVESTGFALTFTVDNLVDESDGDYSAGDLSLREAILMSSNASGTDKILFDASLSGGTIYLDAALGELLIDTPMAIDAGDLVGGLTIDASETDPTLLVNNGDGTRVFRIDDGSAATQIDVLIEGIALSGGDVTGDGGGVYSLENLSLLFVFVNDNAATGQGGGIFHKDGALVIEDSTVANNRAGDDGGGLYSNTSLDAPRTGRITQSTFSGNQAGDEGGGVFNFDGLLTIQRATITNNTALDGGGVVSYGDGATRTRVSHTIIAGNTGFDVERSKNLFFNSFVTDFHNLIGIGSATAAFDDNDFDTIDVADPLLGPLSNNGGKTLTHKPMAGSLAIDAGDTAFAYFEEVFSHSPVLHWNLDEESGSEVADSVDDADGTLGSGVTLDQPGAALNTGNSAAIDSSEMGFPIQSVSPPLDLSSFGSNYSISLWFNATSTSELQRLLELEDDPSMLPIVAVDLLPTGKVGFLGGELDSNTSFVADQWYNVVVVRDGSDSRIYVNGALDNEGVNVQDPIDNSEATLFVGSGRSSDRLDGSLDEIILYDSALSGQDVSDLFESATTPAAEIILADQRGEPFPRLEDGNSDGTETVDIGAVEAPEPETNSDFNGDTTVNGFDFLAWQLGFGTTSGATVADGDSNNDGDVDGDDLKNWEDDYGSVVPSSPLPQTFVPAMSFENVAVEVSESAVPSADGQAQALDTNVAAVAARSGLFAAWDAAWSRISDARDQNQPQNVDEIVAATVDLPDVEALAARFNLPSKSRRGLSPMVDSKVEEAAIASSFDLALERLSDFGLRGMERNGT